MPSTSPVVVVPSVDLHTLSQSRQNGKGQERQTDELRHHSPVHEVLLYPVGGQGVSRVGLRVRGREPFKSAEVAGRENINRRSEDPCCRGGRPDPEAPVLHQVRQGRTKDQEPEQGNETGLVGARATAMANSQEVAAPRHLLQDRRE